MMGLQRDHCHQQDLHRIQVPEQVRSVPATSNMLQLEAGLTFTATGDD